MRWIVFPAAAVVLCACGPAQQGADFLVPGVYQGTDRAGNEYTVEVIPGKIKVNGADTEIDDTKRQTTFTAIHSPGKPTWTCRSADNDSAATCQLHAGAVSTTLDLMKEKEIDQ